MKRVLLIHPYIKSRFSGAPMGLLYIAAILRSAGHDVCVLDLQADSTPNRLGDQLMAFDPQIVGIASTSPSHKAALDVAIEVKRFNREIIIVKGGVHETYCAEHTLLNNQQIDYSMHGDVDNSIVTFVDNVGTSAVSSTPFLAFREGTEVRLNPGIARGSSLDKLPYPARDLLVQSSYYDFKIFAGRRTTQVQTMRGCPFSCSFCNQRNRTPDLRSVQSVIEELVALQSEGYEAVFFDDATFTVFRDRTRELCRAISSARIKMQFACQTRSELIDPETACAMADAGFVYVSFGLETTDENALRYLLKTRSVTKHKTCASNAVSLCKQFGIASCLNLIVGLPNETVDTLTKTLDFVSEVSPTYVSMSALALYPHEDITTALLYTQGVSTEDVWIHYDEGTGAVHPYLSVARAEWIYETACSVLGERLAVV